MKKKLKKVSAILMCAWNLYMPNSIQDEQELQIQANSNVPVVEEIILEEASEEVDEETKKGKTKHIFSFFPSFIWTIFGFFSGLFKYPLLFILGLLFLLFIGWLLLKDKPWACVLGIGAGSGLIYMDIQDVNQIIEESYLGIFFILYFLIILIFRLKLKNKELVKE